MKKFSKSFGKSLANVALVTVKSTTTATLGVVGGVLSVANSSAVAGCNLGIQRLNGKKSSFLDELRKQNDLRYHIDKVVDRRVTWEEFVDSVMPDEYHLVMDEIKRAYDAASPSKDPDPVDPKDAFDLNDGKTAPVI